MDTSCDNSSTAQQPGPLNGEPVPDAQRQGQDAPAGAPPSNTAPSNLIEVPSYAQILHTGVDSHYLSYTGELKPDVEATLESLKADGSALQCLIGSPGGGGAPRTVIRGESSLGTSITSTLVMPEGFHSLAGVHPFAAHTDWLNCSIPTEGDPEFHNTFIQQFFEIAGGLFAPMTECGGGLHGWKQSFKLNETGARLAIGGQNDTLFLSMPGHACTLIPLVAWPVLATLLDTHYSARITRWDGAVDDYEGQYSVDWAVDQYKDNQFNAGGHKPSCSQQGNWLDPDGSGRTFYIGKRKNGKLLRIYEKGKQLGDPKSPWVRWELELHNRQREIPWGVLIKPGSYVAGAYPCTGWVSGETSRIRTVQKTAKIGYTALIHFARQGYGPLINVMVKQGMSPEKIIKRLIRDGTPGRLKFPIPPEMKTSVLDECDP